MKISATDHPDTQPLAYGHSAVTLRELSRIPSRHSAVGARLSSRLSTDIQH
jgi:hypothetical protein